jgi:hypothetical protein
VSFENLQVAVWSTDAALLQRLAPDLGARSGAGASNVIANLEVTASDAGCRIEQRGRPEGMDCDAARLPFLLKREIATVFALARRRYAWLHAAALSRSGRGVVIAGDTGGPNDSLLRALESHGWVLQDGSMSAIRVEDLTVVPLGARAQPEGAAAQAGRVAVPFAGLVVATRTLLHATDAPAPLSPSAAVAATIGVSLDFSIERTRTVTHLCRLLEQRPAAQLHWSRPDEAARRLTHWADALSAVDT